MEGQEMAVQVANAAFLAPVATVQQAVTRYKEMVSLIRSELWHRGTDSGEIPGASKATLLKPGAEKLCMFFGLAHKFVAERTIEDWTGEEHGGEPLFAYRERCELYRDGVLVGMASADCHSWEARYRYRWVNREDVPVGVPLATLQRRDATISEPTFAIKRRETSGKYGKPLEYWDEFDRAIEAGEAASETRISKAGKPYEVIVIPGEVFRVPNENPADVTNTLIKMAQKRALVAAVLIATNASEFFTQDLEDMSGLGDVVDSTARPAQSAQPAEATSQGTQAARAPEPPPPPPPEPLGHWTESAQNQTAFYTRVRYLCRELDENLTNNEIARAVLEAAEIDELTEYTGGAEELAQLTRDHIQAKMEWEPPKAEQPRLEDAAPEEEAQGDVTDAPGVEPIPMEAEADPDMEPPF